jgi:hypothetical protein
MNTQQRWNDDTSVFFIIPQMLCIHSTLDNLGTCLNSDLAAALNRVTAAVYECRVVPSIGQQPFFKA